MFIAGENFESLMVHLRKHVEELGPRFCAHIPHLGVHECCAHSATLQSFAFVFVCICLCLSWPAHKRLPAETFSTSGSCASPAPPGLQNCLRYWCCRNTTLLYPSKSVASPLEMGWESLNSVTSSLYCLVSKGAISMWVTTVLSCPPWDFSVDNSDHLVLPELREGLLRQGWKALSPRPDNSKRSVSSPHPELEALSDHLSQAAIHFPLYQFHALSQRNGCLWRHSSGQGNI